MHTFLACTQVARTLFLQFTCGKLWRHAILGADWLRFTVKKMVVMTTTTTQMQSKPPEISYPKFQRFISHLKHDATQGNAPVRLDASWWVDHGYKDHAERSRLRAAAQFMGVTNQENELTPNGRNLLYPIPNTDLLRTLFEHAFQKILSVAYRDGVSRAELKRALATQWRVSDAGADRALPFFLSGALALELPISPSLVTNAARRHADHLQETASNGSTGKHGQNGHVDNLLNSGQEGFVSLPSVTAVGTAKEQPGSKTSTRTVRLRKGGSVTLTVSMDIFDVDDDEREWVLDLVDRVKKHEAKSEECHDVNSQD